MWENWSNIVYSFCFLSYDSTSNSPKVVLWRLNGVIRDQSYRWCHMCSKVFLKQKSPTGDSRIRAGLHTRHPCKAAARPTLSSLLSVPFSPRPPNEPALPASCLPALAQLPSNQPIKMEIQVQGAHSSMKITLFIFKAAGHTRHTGLQCVSRSLVFSLCLKRPFRCPHRKATTDLSAIVN